MKYKDIYSKELFIKEKIKGEKVHPVSLRKKVLGLYYSLAKKCVSTIQSMDCFLQDAKETQTFIPWPLVPFSIGVTLLVSGQTNTQKCVAQ